VVKPCIEGLSGRLCSELEGIGYRIFKEKLGEVVHPLSSCFLGIMANMWPGSIRDTNCITYRCFLPDLTRFVTVCCAAAGRRPFRFVHIPIGGIQPRISGFREKGTA